MDREAGTDSPRWLAAVPAADEPPPAEPPADHPADHPAVGQPSDAGGEEHRRAWRLVQRSRIDRPEQVLDGVDVEPGDTGHVAMVSHYVRGVALHELGDHPAAMVEADLALAAAEDAADPGWRAVTLTLRATERLLQAASEDTPAMDDQAVADLARAETLLIELPERSWLRSSVHTGLAIAYHLMGLYELVLPHLEAPLIGTTQRHRTPADTWTRKVNLAAFHLDWAADIDRAGAAGADGHRRAAARHAAGAAALVDDAVRSIPAAGAHPSTVTTVGARHRDRAELLLACARVQAVAAPGRGVDAGGLAVHIADLVERLATDPSRGTVRQALPYLARAQQVAGRPADALATARFAVDEAGTDEVLEATARETLLHLLAAQGQPGAAEGLAYGRLLSADLWRRRGRRLREARMLLEFESLRDEHARTARLSAQDDVTGLANRRRFETALDEIAAGSADTPVVVVAVALDGLAAVNRAAGRPAGDILLRHVGAALGSVIRAGDLVARTGGDTFAVLLAGVDGPGGTAIARRALEAVHAVDPAAVGGRTLTVGLGLAVGPADRVRRTVTEAEAALDAAGPGQAAGRVAVARTSADTGAIP